MEWIHDPVLANRMTSKVCPGLEEAYFKKKEENTETDTDIWRDYELKKRQTDKQTDRQGKDYLRATVGQDLNSEPRN